MIALFTPVMHFSDGCSLTIQASSAFEGFLWKHQSCFSHVHSTYATAAAVSQFSVSFRWKAKNGMRTDAACWGADSAFFGGSRCLSARKIV